MTSTRGTHTRTTGTPRAPETEYEQLWSGVWTDAPQTWSHQCCSCGLVHTVKLRLHNGKLEMQWNPDRAETRRVRRRKQRER